MKTLQFAVLSGELLCKVKFDPVIDKDPATFALGEPCRRIGFFYSAGCPEIAYVLHFRDAENQDIPQSEALPGRKDSGGKCGEAKR